MGVFEDRKQSGSLTALWNGSGTEPANTAVTISMPAASVVYAQLDGTFTATMTWEVSINETTFVAIAATNVNSGVRATTATTAGIYAIPAAGRKIRARCSAFTSGPITTTLSATNGAADQVSLAGVSGGTGNVVDTELTAAAINLDAFDTGTTGYPMCGVIVHGLTQGATTASRIKAHDGSLDARGTSINGLVGSSYGYAYNGASWDRVRSGTSVATTQGGTGFPGVVPLLFTSAGDFRAMASANQSADNTSGSTEAWTLVSTYNGSNTDRQRNNTDVIIQASTATSTQTINTDITTYNAGKILFHFNITNYNGGTFTAKLQWKDANGLFWDIPGATTGAKTSGADLVLALGANTWPTSTTTEFYANFGLPRQVRLVETIATATITFSAAYSTNSN